jgi:hypothetical protein
MSRRPLVPEPCGCAGKDGGLAQVLQEERPHGAIGHKAPEHASQKTKIAGAIRYALSRWQGLTRFLCHGHIPSHQRSATWLENTAYD